MSSAAYAACTRNLSDFIAALPKTGVRFMYFQRRNLFSPVVSTALSSWEIGGALCFVVPAAEPEHCSVYRRSAVERMFSLNRAAPAESAAFSSAGSSGSSGSSADHGDHVTFGFILSLSRKIIIKTRKDSYDEIASLKFDRRSRGECRFRAPPSDSAEAESRERFGSILCDGPYGQLSLSDTYKRDALVPDIVYALYRVVAGSLPPPASPQRNGRKKYQQRGAAPDYKGIGFTSPAFTRFLSETIFQPVASQRPDLVSVQVFFDELSELGKDTNRTILILYDFEEDERNVFYIQTETAIAAVYAAEHPAEATAYETACLQQFLAAVAHPTTGLAASVAPL